MTTYIITGGNICDEQVRNAIFRGNLTTEHESDVADMQKDHFQSAQTVIAADKGMECCIRLGIKPDYLIGDFDSASEAALLQMRQEGVTVTELNPIKDDTDTEAALHLAFEKTQGDIVILGGMGSRLDHVLGNIAILGQGFARQRSITMVDSHNRIRLVEKDLIIPKEEQFGKYVSVIPFGDVIERVTLEGFYYPLDQYRMEGYSSIGISNEIVEQTGKIIIEGGVAIVVESRD